MLLPMQLLVRQAYHFSFGQHSAWDSANSLSSTTNAKAYKRNAKNSFSINSCQGECCDSSCNDSSSRCQPQQQQFQKTCQKWHG